MGWQDNIHPEVTFISPLGNFFKAKWVGDDIEAEKRVAMFDYPNVDGTIVQDLGLKGFNWPMTIYFDDDFAGGFPDPDSKSMSFMESLSEKDVDGLGIWRVTHPIYGQHELQALKFVLKADPVNSGGVFVITTTWIEPTQQHSVISTAQRQNAIVAHVFDLNAISAAQAALNAIQNLQDQVFALRSAYQQAIAPIKSAIGVANAAVNTVTDAINSLLVAPVLDVVSVVSQIQTLVQSPLVLVGEVNTAIGALQSMVVNVLNTLPIATAQDAQNDINSKNQVAAVESVALAIIGGAATAVSSATLTTRLEAVTAMNGLSAMLSTITTALDAQQAYYASVNIENQFFSQSKSYANAVQTIAETLAYLSELSFSLKSIKMYDLQTGRASLEIAMSEYGKPGVPWDDAFYDLFIESNNLRDVDILWLPAGRTVTIYV